jgi:hypothetical protein
MELDWQAVVEARAATSARIETQEVWTGEKVIGRRKPFQ